MIRNGDVELKAREEEIRFLKMEVTDSRKNLLNLFSSTLACQILRVGCILSYLKHLTENKSSCHGRIQDFS